MDARQLEKMTVVKLREEALKHPELKGVHGMGKAELVRALKQVLSLPTDEKPKAGEPTVKDLKHRIRAVKADREKALAAKDKASLVGARKQIKRLKRRIRKIQSEAARLRRLEKAPATAEG